jgi:hypothetical protein
MAQRGSIFPAHDVPSYSDVFGWPDAGQDRHHLPSRSTIGLRNLEGHDPRWAPALLPPNDPSRITIISAAPSKAVLHQASVAAGFYFIAVMDYIDAFVSGQMRLFVVCSGLNEHIQVCMHVYLPSIDEPAAY